jgi:hypothetical protein
MRLDPPLPKAVTKNSSGIHAPGDRPHAQVDDSNGGIPSPNRSSAVLGSNVAVPFSTSKATLWVSCIDAPDCAYVNWERLLNSITPQEKIKVQRYRTVKDQRHALTSILLQRALIRASFLVSDRDYQILRTSEVVFWYDYTLTIYPCDNLINEPIYRYYAPTFRISRTCRCTPVSIMPPSGEPRSLPSSTQAVPRPPL